MARGGHSTQPHVNATPLLDARAPVKFSLSMTLEASRRGGITPNHRYTQFLEDMEFCDDAGFTTVLISEHHFMPDAWCPSPLIACAAVAGRTREIRVGSAIVILPLHNPLRVAEDVAVLDVASNGRAVLGVGQGYRPGEFEAFGVRFEERTSRFVESLDLLPRFWTEEHVTHDGKHFAFHDLNVTPKPVQQPHPPIWVGADTEPAIRRIGRRGLTYYFGNMAPLPLLERRKATYDQGLADGGHAPPPDRPLMRELYVSDSFDQAWKEAGEYFLFNYRDELIGLGYGVPAPDGTYVTDVNDPLFEPRNLVRDRIIIGSPDDCIREIERCRDILGTTEFFFRIYHHDLPARLIRRSLELFTAEVMPYFADGASTRQPAQNLANPPTSQGSWGN